jgi:hypothetical protein
MGKVGDPNDPFRRMRVSPELVGKVGGLGFRYTSFTYGNQHETHRGKPPAIQYLFNGDLYHAFLFAKEGYMRIETRAGNYSTGEDLPDTEWDSDHKAYFGKIVGGSCTSLIGPAITTCGCEIPQCDDSPHEFSTFIIRHLISGSCATTATRKFCINNVEYTEKRFLETRRKLAPHWNELITNPDFK